MNLTFWPIDGEGKPIFKYFALSPGATPGERIAETQLLLMLEFEQAGLLTPTPRIFGPNMRLTTEDLLENKIGVYIAIPTGASRLPEWPPQAADLVTIAAILGPNNPS